MLIDWFTVIAQAVNFLILVWLMKRFLYQPILKALDAREQRIAGELADADARKAEAGAEREEFRRRNEEFDREHAVLLGKATGEAAAERHRLIEEARREAQTLRDRLQDKLDGEYRGLHEEIARRIQAEVFSVARKALADLADTGLEERIAQAFARRVQELGGSEREKLVASPDTGAMLRSAFELPEVQRASVEAAVRAALGAGIAIHFEVAPNLIGGIELIKGGHKIAWSLADYLESLERELAVLLKAHQQTERHGN